MSGKQYHLKGDIAIGNRVRELREKRKLTQKELAEKVMVSSSVITRLEKGQTMVSVFTLIEISKVLEVSVADILTDKSTFHEIELSNVITRLKTCSPEQRQVLIQCFEQILDVIFFE